MLLILGEPPKPLPPQPSQSPPLSIQGNDAFSQEVTGEYGYPHHLLRNMGVNGLALSAGRSDHIMLFRIYVSRKAAGKARAVLEGLSLDTSTTDACFSAHAANDEEIVQAGLVKWKEGQGLLQKQPPTWKVLLSAMEYAGIAQQHIMELKEKLASPV